MSLWWQRMSLRYPRLIIGVSIAMIVVLGWYGVGIFGGLEPSTDAQPKWAESTKVREEIAKEFGANAKPFIVLFEPVNDRLGEADSRAFQAEVSRLLTKVEPQAVSVQGFATTGSRAFISKDASAAYAAVVMRDEKNAYEQLRSFADTEDSSVLDVRIGGMEAVNKEMGEAVSQELARIELISLPVLLILLLLFFRSPIAALMPVGIALFTVLGAFAIARWLAHFVDIDSYAVNVVTMLGIGLSIDYALLSVNRFREELPHGVDAAVKKVIATSGHTVFFSGITVIACLLSLLIFPVGLMHSIAIGGASAVAVAMLTTYIVLPSALKLIGTRIDLGRYGRKNAGQPVKSRRGFWQRAAHVATARPVYSLLFGLVVIAAALIPLSRFQSGDMTYKWLARNTEAGKVAQVLAERFLSSNPDAVVIVRTATSMSDVERIRLSCAMTERIDKSPRTLIVRSATPISDTMPCSAIEQVMTGSKVPADLRAVAARYMTPNVMRFDVTLDPGDQKAGEQAILTLRDLTTPQGEVLVGGSVAELYDSNRVYIDAAPWAIGIIVISMVALLAIALRSVVVPLQAIVMNCLGLAISMAVIVGIFQLGWFGDLTKWPQVDGIMLAAPILVAAVAFGLAMDYSVFLYSRMREAYDQTGDSRAAVRQGIVKTGPIITAAAIALFVVVIGFATSSLLFMQIIGVGLAVAVIVDAFFVRLVFVPAVMTLLGRHGWK